MMSVNGDLQCFLVCVCVCVRRLHDHECVCCSATTPITDSNRSSSNIYRSLLWYRPWLASVYLMDTRVFGPLGCFSTAIWSSEETPVTSEHSTSLLALAERSVWTCVRERTCGSVCFEKLRLAPGWWYDLQMDATYCSGRTSHFSSLMEFYSMGIQCIEGDIIWCNRNSCALWWILIFLFILS